MVSKVVNRNRVKDSQRVEKGRPFAHLVLGIPCCTIDGRLPHVEGRRRLRDDPDA